MIRERRFYRAFFALAMSLALQNLLTFGVNLMDTVMLGRYSQDAMSGVSLCNQVQFLLQMLVTGAGEGAVVLGAQYWGRGRLEPVPHIIGVALRFGGGLAAALLALVLIAPEALLRLLSNEEAVIAQGVQYFQIICFTYVIFTVTNIQCVAQLPADLWALGLSGAWGPGGSGGHAGLPVHGAGDCCLVFEMPGETAAPYGAEAALHR